MVFVLQEIRCWIWIEVRCQNIIIVGWQLQLDTLERWSFAWAQLETAIFISCQCISSAVSLYRNLHQGFSGFDLLNFSSKWTSNVQELLTLLGSEGTGSTLFSLNHCVQVSSSSSLSHFQVVQEFWLRTTWQVFRSFSWILVVPSLLKAQARSLQRITDQGVRKNKGRKLFRLASQPCDLYWMDGSFQCACVSR